MATAPKTSPRPKPRPLAPAKSPIPKSAGPAREAKRYQDMLNSAAGESTDYPGKYKKGGKMKGAKK